MRWAVTEGSSAAEADDAEAEAETEAHVAEAEPEAEAGHAVAEGVPAAAAHGAVFPACQEQPQHHKASEECASTTYAKSRECGAFWWVCKRQVCAGQSLRALHITGARVLGA